MSETLDAVKATLSREKKNLDKELKQPWYDCFVVGALVMGIAIGGVMIFRESSKYSELHYRATEHIKIVTMTDKNCNDCHLGAYFVNLFNHEAVKSNDNVTRLMMDRAKIKQW